MSSKHMAYVDFKVSVMVEFGDKDSIADTVQKAIKIAEEEVKQDGLGLKPEDVLGFEIKDKRIDIEHLEAQAIAREIVEKMEKGDWKIDEE
jgi:hypothetical protein